ncbi:MAG: hypothetical protein AUJ52_01665 [Elusimicrobia bacterium CG1_02_63_36]|nr:MAG: hypothetical protein AUJ52_01665 [Elusimicrobia bacterium CG1_02_63_36]
MALIKKLWSKKHRWKTATALALLVAAGGAWFWHQKRKSAEAENAEDTRADVDRGSLEVTFEELGDIAAKNIVNVPSKVSGRVMKLYVEEGQTVKEGRELAIIQPGKTAADKYLPSTVVAPIGGLLLRYVKNPDGKTAPEPWPEVGDYVTGLFDSTNPNYLMSVADMGELVVRLKINELDILKLKEGMPVTVSVDALPDEDFEAKVAVISPQAERENRGGKVFRVEVAIAKADPRLRNGMTARVKAVLEKREGVLKIPLSGLYEEKGLNLVYLDREAQQPKQVFVKAGLRTETDVEILEGLTEGQKIHTEKPVLFEEIPKDDFKERKKKLEESEKSGDGKKSRKASRRAMRAARSSRM